MVNLNDSIMRITTYLKVTLIVILTNISHMVFAQEKIVRYQDFELAYSNNSDLKIISNRFDLFFLLLLDPTYKVQFFEYDAELKDLYKGYSYGLRLNESTVGFVAHIKKIDEIFSSSLLINKAFNCISNEETHKSIKQTVNYPVYIKDNTAIVEISSGSSSGIYYFRLHDGVVQINWLGGVME